MDSSYIDGNFQVGGTVLVSLQQDLTSRGLDSHLSTAFNSGDKYFAHVV